MKIRNIRVKVKENEVKDTKGKERKGKIFRKISKIKNFIILSKKKIFYEEMNIIAARKDFKSLRQNKEKN